MNDLPFADLLLANLGRGSDNALTYSELADRFRCPRRKIENAVQELRLRGWAIITDDRGCWLSFSPQETRRMYRRLRSRYIHQAVTARSLLRTAERMERSQMTLGI